MNKLRLFGTSGIRGKAKTQITTKLAKKIGLTFASFLRNEGTILVGRDVRLTAKSLSNALISGLILGGVNVQNCGIAPTPAVLWALKKKKLDAAIKLHLKEPAKKLKNAKIAEQGPKIISALHAIRRFRNTLLADIHDLITSPARDELTRAEKNRAVKEAELNDAEKKYSDLEKAKDSAEIDYEQKLANANEGPFDLEKKKLSDAAKKELELAQKELSRAEKDVEEKQAAST